MKTKYDYHPDLVKFQKMHTPLLSWFMPFTQMFMKSLYHLEKEDEQIGIKQWKIPSADGYEIAVFEYYPKKDVSDFHILFYHGGGFVFPASPQHFFLVRSLVRFLSCRVYMVDYRLAPKYVFPKAVEDCFAVYEWLVKEQKSKKIAVCGDSAGGNLATVVCLMAKDRNVKMPCAQMLLYPVCDYRMQSESMKKYVDTPLCNSKDVKKYFQMYVKEYDVSWYPYLSPLEALSLKDMPKTYMEVAEYDCLRDEGIQYAKRLEQEGVEVELHEVAASMHGYDIAVHSLFMVEIMKQRIAFFKKIL